MDRDRVVEAIGGTRCIIDDPATGAMRLPHRAETEALTEAVMAALTTTPPDRDLHAGPGSGDRPVESGPPAAGAGVDLADRPRSAQPPELPSSPGALRHLEQATELVSRIELGDRSVEDEYLLPRGRTLLAAIVLARARTGVLTHESRLPELDPRVGALAWHDLENLGETTAATELATAETTSTTPQTIAVYQLANRLARAAGWTRP